MNLESFHKAPTPADKSAESPILLVPYMWIGDFVRCHTVVKLLQERFPSRPIDVLTTTTVAPLLDYMPGVRQGIIVDLPRRRFGLFGEKTALRASNWVREARRREARTGFGTSSSSLRLQ